ncbi:MAG: UDP-3-O-(3-hydroxymyristoyl)glucosamine N-acyltransferase [Pirellulaceae bacterium]
MAHTLRELAVLVGGRLTGDGELLIEDASTIRDARAGFITLADKPKLMPALAACQASAVVVPRGFEPEGMPFITVENVHGSFARIVARFRPRRERRRIGVSPAAHVSPTAVIGEGVDIHPTAVIGDDVEIGAGSVIHPGVVLMDGCRIGRDVLIFPHVVLYENTVIGDRVILHAGTVLGAYGFGYDFVDGRHRLSAQMGNVEVGDDVEIGADCTIDRGTYGPTTVGEGTKIDDQVMIGHNCRIGRHNLLCSQVGIAGSCTTGDYVVMAGQVGIGDHIDIGDKAILGAKAGVMHDIPAATTMLGIPATPVRDQMVMQAALAKLPEMRKQLRDLRKQVDQLLAEREVPAKQEAA